MLVGRTKEVNTHLNAKTSGWPIVSPSRMSTIVTSIRDHAPKAQTLVAIIMISLVQHKKLPETKSSLSHLQLGAKWVAHGRHTGALGVTLDMKQKA